MKGIILAGGKGTRLYPITLSMSKQLQPVYDKPMIYYPLSMLMLGGIQEILVISTPQDLPNFQHLLGDGSQWGLSFSYAEQPEPKGLAEAFIIGKGFIGPDSVCLILGDNIFYGNDMPRVMQDGAALKKGGMILAYPVKDPERYGVVEFDDKFQALSLEEKPKEPRSRYAVPGVYFYDNEVVSLAEQLTPSSRDEIEITDLNRIYLERNELQVRVLGRGFAWLDAGTHQSLLQAANFVAAVQERQGLKISCPEEIAYRMGFINLEQLEKLGKQTPNSYGTYLLQLVDEYDRPR